MAKPKILITNDDGVNAPGIFHLWKALQGVGDIVVIAPCSERSGAGLSLTTQAPLHIKPVKWADGGDVWSVSGTPVDCVKMGLSVMLDSPPDIVVSGINRGSNAGRNSLYSGTVGGAIEAVMQGIPGVAFSCYDHQDPNYALAEPYIPLIVRYVLEHKLPDGTMLNVNFPEKEKTIKGIKLARQGKEIWMENPTPHGGSEGSKSYWVGAKINHYEEHEESDIAWLEKGYIAAVPLHIHQMTDFGHYEKHSASFDQHFID